MEQYFSPGNEAHLPDHVNFRVPEDEQELYAYLRDNYIKWKFSRVPYVLTKEIEEARDAFVKCVNLYGIDRFMEDFNTEFFHGDRQSTVFGDRRE